MACAVIRAPATFVLITFRQDVALAERVPCNTWRKGQPVRYYSGKKSM